MSLWTTQDDCTRFEQFPPGHYYSSKTNKFTRYFNPQYYLDFEAKPERWVDWGGLDIQVFRADAQTVTNTHTHTCARACQTFLCLLLCLLHFSFLLVRLVNGGCQKHLQTSR